MKTSSATIEEVKDYYSKVLSSQKDLKTSACCVDENLPRYIKDIIPKINGEILDKFYGCGSPIPHSIEGKIILDLGCGTGRDVYIASALTGENGKVIGVDMTREQLDVARSHIDTQMKVFGYAKSNVEFIQGYNEELVEIPSQSVDVVISNCVINLSPNKEKVFSEIFRVLKPGGELYFSDVFSDRRIPENLKNDPVLYGECLSGAIYLEDLRRLFEDMGCPDYRVFSSRKIEISDREIKAKLGLIKFYSVTVRAFKLNSLEDKCEDYGQTATYLGTIEHAPDFYILDDHHLFEKNKPALVCGNTASMLSETRFGQHFNVMGKKEVHYGLFDCVPSVSPKTDSSSEGACC